MLRRGDEAVRDAFGGAFVTVTGSIPFITFRGSTTKEARALVTGAGLPWPENLLEYGNEEEFLALLQRAKPRRVVFQNAHPPDPSLDPAYWVPRGLLTRLNDKAELGALVPREACPPRRIMSLERAATLSFEPGTTVVLKGSTSMSSGSGGAVLIARDEAALRSVPERLAGCDRVVVEEFQPFTRTMCLNLAADHQGVVHYVGSADQVVADDGTYMSSWVSPELTPPTSAIALAREIMTRAAALGYIGFAGFDIGLLPDGRALFFDLNFRVCGSTPTLLWYEEVRRRIGPGAWARAISISARTPFAELCATGRRLADEDSFLPTGGFDPAGTIWEGRMPHLRGIMMGRDRAETEARCEALLAQGLTYR
jgi:hypothetical protein